MPHADAALFPQGISKDDAYKQVGMQLGGLFEGQRNWVCNLANAASLLWAMFHALPEPLNRVNWAGFYVRSDLFPSAKKAKEQRETPLQLLLAPFAGLPACQSIPLPPPGSPRAPGVCAAAFLTGEVQIVPDVEKRSGHIACDAKTRSEIVLPIRVENGSNGERLTVGVLDIDCELDNGFDETDQVALQHIVDQLAAACDW